MKHECRRVVQYCEPTTSTTFRKQIAIDVNLSYIKLLHKTAQHDS